MHPAPHIDISAAEQVSLLELIAPELSPDGPSSSASSPSSSVPVTPLDPPHFSTPANPLVYGKHQPDPRPFKPVTKSHSRGNVWRARQVLLSLGRRKRPDSTDTGVSTGVQVLNDYDESDLSESNSPSSEVEPHPSQSLFSLPNVPINNTPRLAQVVRSPTRRSTLDTLPSAPASPVPAAFGTGSNPAPPGAPWAPPGLSLSFAFLPRLIFFLPWCVAVGAAIALYPRALSPLVRMYTGPPRTPLHRLAHHAHTAHAHLGIFLGAVCLVGAALPLWSLRVALVGAVAARTVIVWRGFGARVAERRGKGAVEEVEEWHEDARCVWRVLRGEEEREILRACGDEGMVKEE